jgi:glycosyltransferase involved in cell wall biosynthesis
MKILLVQDWLRGGGTERQAVFLARAFAARGHTVTLLTFRPGGALVGELANHPVRVLALQSFDTRLDWFAPGLSLRAQQLAPDIVLCMGRMANCRAAQFQRALPQASVITTVRTGKSLPWLYRRALRTARHVVANSDYARRTLVAPEGAADRCSVIPNALLFAELLACEQAPAVPPVILNVAQFRRGKGHAELIAICATLQRTLDWKLELVGDGPERTRCERLAATSGIADRVVFHGWQFNPARFYRSASIAALASQPGYESLPNFLVESQCAGLPVVAFDTDGVAETFRDGISGLRVPAGDRARFAEALTSLLTDTARRAAMSAAACTWARERFDPERQVGAYLELFERLRSRA